MIATRMENEVLLGALRDIASANGGVVTQDAVVDAAQNPDHVLHDQFDWDDSTAAHQWRLQQAGALIRRVRVKLELGSGGVSEMKVTVVRAFVSPLNERRFKSNPDGGYASITDVLADPSRRSALVNTALMELKSIRNKYEMLTELSRVWKEIDKIAKQ